MTQHVCALLLLCCCSCCCVSPTQLRNVQSIPLPPLMASIQYPKTTMLCVCVCILFSFESFIIITTDTTHCIHNPHLSHRTDMIGISMLNICCLPACLPASLILIRYPLGTYCTRLSLYTDDDVRAMMMTTDDPGQQCAYRTGMLHFYYCFYCYVPSGRHTIGYRQQQPFPLLARQQLAQQ